MTQYWQGFSEGIIIVISLRSIVDSIIYFVKRSKAKDEGKA